ncbi:MAG: serine hydrolase [Clostridiales Family XIII bacterium]|jgi:D-alanyl-D-alanine carboxypeptidase (penicillin-binding protein 5/6)|nr:serine hydrolase [Clostridiales Family XIII bacterium]
MKKVIGRVSSVIVAVAMLCTSFAYAADSASVARVGAPKAAKGVFAMDVVTGKTLCAKSADKARPVASTSKLMTAYLVHEKIESGGGAWTDKVRITDKKLDKMSRLSPYGGSVRLTVGRLFTIRQLYILMLVESHNAASVQLGRWVSGSDKKFAKLMNKAADELGMKNSSFVNACGLDNLDYYNDLKIPYVGKRSDTNMMSPRDAAKLARALVTEHPSVLNTTKRATAKVKGRTIYTSNHILDYKNLMKKAKGLNVTGLKTGYIDRSGHCFIGTCKKKGRDRLVTVILNDSDRFNHTISIMKNIYKKNPEAV